MSARHPRTLTEPRVIIGFNLRAQELCESLKSLKSLMVSVDIKQHLKNRVQELCESRGGRPGLPVPKKKRLVVSVDVKQHTEPDSTSFFPSHSSELEPRGRSVTV